jgi:hypothetical protein
MRREIERLDLGRQLFKWKPAAKSGKRNWPAQGFCLVRSG